jgi:hypothetical protein
MNRHLGTNWFSDNSHPAEDELLYYVDGELPGPETARIRAHLEACWTCRAKTEHIQETISAFVHFLDTSVAPNIGAPPHGWRSLEAGMAEVAAQAGKRPLLLQWCGSLKKVLAAGPSARTLAAGFAVAVAIFLVIVDLDRVPPVSANQLIENVVNVEIQGIRTVVQPVVYRKLQVRRTAPASAESGVATWEVWSDISHNRFKQRIEEPGSRSASEFAPGPRALPAVFEELKQVFEANRMDPRSPLSSAAFEAWRGRIQRRSEAVDETSLADGSRAFTLTTHATGPFAPNAIIQAQIVVRNADWHTVEQRLRVQGQSGVLDFSLTEVAFAVQPLGGLPPALFASSAPTAVPRVVPRPAPPAEPVFTPVAGPSPAELTASEIEALFALHRIRACLGGMVSVDRLDSGAIEVRGFVGSEERREEILASLRGIPWVETKIQTAEEAAGAVPSTSPGPEGSSTGNDAGLQPGRMPIQELLSKYFSRNGPATGSEAARPGGVGARIATFSHRVVGVSEAALEEAWALRRVLERSASLQAGEPRPSAQYALEVMIRDHMTALRTQMNAYRQLVEPVLSSVEPGGEDPAVAIEKTPAPDSSALFDRVEQIVHLSLALFTNNSFPPQQLKTAMRELQWELGHWEVDYQNLQTRVSRSYPTHPEPLAVEAPE